MHPRQQVGFVTCEAQRQFGWEFDVQKSAMAEYLAAPPEPGTFPGWYPDPDETETQRYWDGAHWEDDTATRPPNPAWG